jgi:hypothetical protein
MRIELTTQRVQNYLKMKKGCTMTSVTKKKVFFLCIGVVGEYRGVLRIKPRAWNMVMI